ncbi:MAG: ATP-dependent Clp protease ATP-binding subunit [Clostridia bacterium]|nr:ATP-dependent Clp protease ATP-binding subunit [Clostridia bacterium]
MENKFTSKAQGVLTQSLNAAQELGQTYIGSEHLLIGLLSERESVAARMLNKRGITLTKIKAEIKNSVPDGERTVLTPRDISPRLQKIIENASLICEKNSQGLIGSEHLLYSLLSESDCPAVILLEQCGLYTSEMKSDILAFISSSQKLQRGSDSKSKEERIALDSFGRHLVSLARSGKIDPTLCREKETERVIQILSRRTKNNPCLIGEAGVGKTAVVEGLASRIANGSVPPPLKSKTIFALDIPSLIAGAKYRGEFEERIKKIMRECLQNPNIILFIDEIHTIIGAGSAEGAIDAANILKPALSRGEIQIIGATTVSEYRKHIEKDSALERRFQPVTVNEPSIKDTQNILFGLKPRYEAHHGIKITDDAIISAVELSQKYINDRFLPDKAIDLIDEAASRVKIRGFSSPDERYKLENEISLMSAERENAILSRKLKEAREFSEKITNLEKRMAEISTDNSIQSTELTVSHEDVAEIVRDWTGIPVSKLIEGEKEKLLLLENKLQSRIIGQDEAISLVSQAIRRARLGLKNANQPTGSFIFIGPSGVGKTELCLCLAEILFGSKTALIRFDMSEYMEKHSISKLIGAPAGYIGYGDGGLLTERVRRNPYSIVLFDEIEKAHPEIFNALLQILEDGALTDSQGRRVSFKETLIVMTSNLGTEQREKASLGFFNGQNESSRLKEREKAIKKALSDTFKPEFLNRIDEIIVFNSLNEDNLSTICVQMLHSLTERISSLGIDMEFDEKARDKIVCEAINSHSGARQLRREIRRLIENPLSEKLLMGEINEGDKLIVTEENGQISFIKAFSDQRI